MNGAGNKSVTHLVIGADDPGQRLDNFLIRICKGVPRSHLYRILRSGEVRVNSRRVGAGYRLCAGICCVCRRCGPPKGPNAR